MSDPRDFFEKMVLPSYRDWLSEPLAEHRAKATVGFANDMAERMFYHLGLQKMFGSYGTGKYRDALTKDCDDFGLLRDIADGTKHFHLDRGNRRISRADQTGRGALQWEDWGDHWEDTDYNWEDTDRLIVVTLDNGEQRSLISIVNNVMGMWEWLLKENDL